MKRNQSTALVRLFSSSLRLGLAFGVAGVFASGGFAANTSSDTYYVNDHLASTVATADASGEIAQIEADAFGTQTGAVAQDSRFTGKPYDADMGAYVFPFRNYRSDEARWMSADPSGFPDGENAQKYAPYVLSAIDPLGLLTVNYSGSWLKLELYGRSSETVSWSNGTVSSSSQSTTSGYTVTGSAGYSTGKNGGASGTVGGTYTNNDTTNNGSGTSTSVTGGWSASQLLGYTAIGVPAALYVPPSITGYDFAGWVQTPQDVVVSISNTGWMGNSVAQSELVSTHYSWAGVAKYVHTE